LYRHSTALVHKQRRKQKTEGERTGEVNKLKSTRIKEQTKKGEEKKKALYITKFAQKGLRVYVHGHISQLSATELNLTHFKLHYLLHSYT
jgi:ribosomal protein S8E